MSVFPLHSAVGRRMAAPGRGRRVAGFTLVEILTVVSIIAILLAALIVAVVGTTTRAKIANTAAFIEALEGGVILWRDNFGAGRDYPAMDQGGSGSDTNPKTSTSSKNLRYYLGEKQRRVSAQSSLPGLRLPPAEREPAIMVFEDDRIDDAGCLIDAWDRRLLYNFHKGSGSCPFSGASFAGHDDTFKDSQAVHYDIVSYGPFENGKDEDGEDAKISSWRKQGKR